MANPTSLPTTAAPATATQDSGVVSQQALARTPQVLQKEEDDGEQASLWKDPDIQKFVATLRTELNALSPKWKKGGKEPFGMSYLEAQCERMQGWWDKQKHRPNLGRLKQRWMVGIQNQVSYYKAYAEDGFKGAPPFPTAPVALEAVPSEVCGSDADDYPAVSAWMAAFLRALWQVSYVEAKAPQCFVAKNYKGHNDSQVWGKKRCSIDLYLATAPGKIDRSYNETENGFWDPQHMVDFILHFDAAARRAKVRWWHGLYNDFRVISTINTRLARQALDFKGSFKPETFKANWHGPDPVGVLHLHLDLVPEPPPSPPKAG